MDLLQTILNAQGGNAVSQLSQRFGLDQSQTTSAIGQLLPALLGGLRQNVQQQGGVESLENALTGGNHQRYLEQPDLINDQQTIEEGNGILGHLFGSKDVSRSVAEQASTQTGIGSDVLKQMLPVVATMLMGGLSQQRQASPGGGMLGMLGPLLDRNQDGSIADDVLGMAKNLFRR